MICAKLDDLRGRKAYDVMKLFFMELSISVKETSNIEYDDCIYKFAKHLVCAEQFPGHAVLFPY